MSIDRRRFVRSAVGAGALIFVACDAADDAESTGFFDSGSRDAGTGDGFVDDAGDGLDSDAGDAGVETFDAADPDALDPDADPDAPDVADAADPDAADPDAGPIEECDDPFADGEYIGVVPFLGDPVNFHEPRSQGWDGRLYTDLTLVDADRLITPNDEFFIRTFYPDGISPDDPWTIQVTGLATEATLTMDDLLPRSRTMGTFVLECSGNGDGSQFGLLSAAEWGGVPLSEVFDLLDIDPQATRVLVNGYDHHDVPSNGGHSTPGAAWIFTFEELAEFGAFLATHMNGVPLPLDHGFPVRLYVPGWYGCTCIKWVDEVRFVDEDEPATGQMREFASRTHQDGQPRLARDFRSASMQQAAMPIRVEAWRVNGAPVYRVVGVLWGGFEPTEALQLRFNPGDPWVDVDVCPPMAANQPWTLWSTAWRPSDTGVYAFRCRIDDRSVPTIRLDGGFYDRAVRIIEA